MVKSRLEHEFSHYYSTFKAFNAVSAQWEALLPGYDQTQILAGIMDLSLDSGGLGWNRNVKEGTGGTPYTLTIDGVDINLYQVNNASELLAFVGEYYDALKDPNQANGNPDLVVMQTPWGLSSKDNNYAKYIVDWAGTQLGFTTDQIHQLETAQMSYDTFVTDFLQSAYGKAAGNATALQNLLANVAFDKASMKLILKPETPGWWAPQERSLTVDAAVQFIEDLQKGGLTNDLKTLADGLKLGGLIQNWDGDPSKINALLKDSQFVATVDALIAAFQNGGAKTDYAAAQAVASEVASRLTKYGTGTNATAPYIAAVASVLGDISQMFSGGGGPGSLVKDLGDVQALYGTAEALIPLAHIPMTAAASKALTEIGYGLGDVITIVEGFDQGGVAGGLEAGYAADALAKILSSLPRLGFGALGPYALPIGVAIGLAALFFGGNHDKPGNMPDKYDTENYGQNTANLQGTMGASGQSFTENPSLVTLFGGRTGIQAIEETLAQYGRVDNAPAWLKPIFRDLETKFGASATGAGSLSIGTGGSGKDCNNQQIVGVPGTDGQVYQYTQLDSALNEFQAAYAKARAAGQAAALSWDSAASPGSPPPSDSYTSTSYQAYGNWYA
ncbi:MAG: hypothetical protein ACYDGM_07400 [Vulcanimicrobiaceae bacterium]